MKILVIIVTYNAMKWVERCLGSVRKSSVRSDVLVVDNGSKDGTQTYVRDNYPEVIFIQSERNIGFGKANNIGLQYALDNEYNYVYLLNQDAWVMPDTIEKLIKYSKNHLEYGILSPFQMNSDIRHIDSSFLKYVLSWISNKDICNDMYNDELKDIYTVPDVMAAHWFLTRECLEKVGGFSPSFSHYAEDNNYAVRVYYKGLKIGVVPSLRVAHDRGERVISLEKQMYLDFSQSIHVISNPFENAMKMYFKVICKLFIRVLYYKSIIPLIYAFKITLNLKNILYNRKQSMVKECAFLHLPEFETTF